MEYEELKNIWEQYDQKLNNLEKLNKKMITEILTKKPQRKLNRLLFQNIYGMLIAPIVLSVVLHPYFQQENFDVKFIIGCGFLATAISTIIYIYYKGYISLRKINLQNDSVMESVQKVNDFKNTLYGKMKFIHIMSLFLFVGIILIIWNGLHFDTKTILGITGIVLFNVFWTNKKSKIHSNKIEQMKEDILELEDYKE